MTMSKRQSRRQASVRALAAALLLAGAAALAGCSSVVDAVPTALGGLPEGTPQRPATQPAYPPVHDMPPTRGQAMLSDDEKKRLEAELIATRERAARQAANPEETTASTRPAGAARRP